MRYEVNQYTFEVKLYQDNDDIPFGIQPHYPNGDTFDTFEEAEIWAQLAIEGVTNPNAPYAPIGKNVPGDSKATAEEILEYDRQHPIK
jgi:hypothetical protein